jgi:hypothetical protein
VFEPFNPVTQMMSDVKTGKIRRSTWEKVLSAIIEAKTSLDRIPDYPWVLEDVQDEVETVFCVGVASRCGPDGSIPHEAWVRDAGYMLSPNGKTNGPGQAAFRRVED